MFGGFVGGEDFGGAVVEVGVVEVADARVGGCWDDSDVEEGVGEELGVAEVVEEDAEGVEGGGEVVADLPPGFGVEGVGGAVAGKSAESGGDADGAACVGADGDEG